MYYLDSVTLSNNWKSYYEYYQSDITALLLASYNDEKINDYTCKNYKLAQYFFAFDLVVMVYNEIVNYEGITSAYLNTKYDLVRLQHNLACNDISLEVIFNIFGISFNNNTGIEGIGIEESFEIEPSDITVPTSITVDELLALLGTHCTTIFDDVECI